MRIALLFFLSSGLWCVLPGSLPDADRDPIDPAWTAWYDGPGRDLDIPHALTVDGEGNVYVTGMSGGGKPPPGEPSDFCQDDDGCEDYATIKYSPQGEELWVARYDGPGQRGDRAYALAVDDAGYVYVTGESAGDGTSHDYATIKYSPGGEELWVRRYNGPGDSGDRASALVVDGWGNIIVTGISLDLSDDFKFILSLTTIKYSPAGEELWVETYSPATSSWNTGNPHALVVDGNGNVHVGGEALTEEGDWVLLTLKYSADGEELWSRQYASPSRKFDRFQALEVDRQGNVLISGDASFYGTGNTEFTLVKYAPDGTELWARRFRNVEFPFNAASALATDPSGNIYLAGYSSFTRDQETMVAFTTLKYSTEGALLWERHQGPALGATSAPMDMILDSRGNVLVAGRLGESPSIVKYAPSGEEFWTRDFTTPAPYRYTQALLPDGAEHFYLAGSLKFGSGGLNYITVSSCEDR